MRYPWPITRSQPSKRRGTGFAGPLAARLGAVGLGCIDAPMSGGPVRARDGSMSLMVACSDALWARHQALLLHLADRKSTRLNSSHQ